jgi:hypothetical protein
VSEFHQHPEGGMIYVRTDGGTYVDTQINFEADFGRQLPALPAGAIERIYTQGVRHVMQSKTDVIAGGPMPWDLGDAALAAIGGLLARQASRAGAPHRARAMGTPDAARKAATGEPQQTRVCWGPPHGGAG